MQGRLPSPQRGELLRVTITAYASEETQDRGMETFTLRLPPGELPLSDTLDHVSFLEAPNNQVNGVGVYAARDEIAQQQLYESGAVVYSAAFLTRENVGMAVQAVCGPLGGTEDQAQKLISALTGHSISEGFSWKRWDIPEKRYHFTQFTYSAHLLTIFFQIL